MTPHVEKHFTTGDLVRDGVIGMGKESVSKCDAVLLEVAAGACIRLTRIDKNSLPPPDLQGISQDVEGWHL